MTILLQPGIYEGLIEIGEIQGTSPVNRITLTSSTNNADDVELTATVEPVGLFYFNIGHIRIRYADYITFSMLTIKTSTTTSFGSTFTFFGGTEYLEIKDCNIITYQSSIYGIFAPKFTDNDFENNDLGPDYLTIDNNNIEGNINFNISNPDFRTKNLTISNNIFLTQHISITDIDGVFFLNNKVESTPEGSGTALSIYTTYGESIISGNYFNTKIESISASDVQSSLKIFNNFILSEYVGINISSDHVECYYNNFHIHGSVSEKTAIQLFPGENNIFKNNNFVISGNGRGVTFHYDHSESNNIFDYNNYYAPEGALWQNSSTSTPQLFNLLSDIQQQFPSEANGLNVNPAYNSPLDLHVNNNALKGVALNIPGIETDYDGELRDPLAPDIGADEIMFPPNLTIDTVYISPDFLKGKGIITVSWTATNTGGSILDQNWTDYVYLSTGTQLDENAIKVGERLQNTPLGMGEGYSGSVEVEIEHDEDGSYMFWVIINALNNWGENFDDNAMHSLVLQYEAENRSSLNVNEISVPDEISSGTEITISWVVTNNGDIPTSTLWEDYVYISSDSSYLENPSEFNPDSLIIAKVKNITGLGVGESYSSSQKYFVPILGSGKLYVKVVPDGNNKVEEANENSVSKSVTSNPVNVFQVPLADLIITQVDVPTTAFSGDDIDLSYTIKNIGNAPTTFDRRLDHIYLMNDSVLNDDNPENYIGSKNCILPANCCRTVPLPFRPGSDFLSVKQELSSSSCIRMQERLFLNFLMITMALQAII